MKTKILAISALAFMALACVSCGNNETQNTEKDAGEINIIDEEMTEKGNTLAYETHVKLVTADGVLDHEWTMKYNCFDNMLVTDEEQQKMFEYKYNSDGLVVEDTSNELGITTVYTYDIHGEKINEQNYWHDEKHIGTRYENEYDENGRLISRKKYETYPDENEEAAVEFTEFKYENDRLISENIDVLDAEDRQCLIEYEYDDRGNVISEIRTEIQSGETEKVTSFYMTYNSRNLPETKEMLSNGEFDMRWEYEYTFYDE